MKNINRKHRTKYRFWKLVNCLLLGVLVIVALACWSNYQAYVMASEITAKDKIVLLDMTNKISTLSAQKKQLETEIAQLQVTPTPVKAPKTVTKAKSVVNTITQFGDIESKVRDATISAFGSSQWDAMKKIIQGESNFNPRALNPHGGAAGIFQALPASKLLNKCGSLENIDCQIAWGIDYIKSRYGNPINAWAFHQRMGWF